MRNAESDGFAFTPHFSLFTFQEGLMPNKTKMQSQYVIAETVIGAAVLVKDDHVRITANNTVNQAAATHKPRGYVVTPNQAVNGNVVVAFRGRAIQEIKASATIAADDDVKMAALSGTDQQIAVWVAGTDAESLKLGYALKGAAANATATIILY
jgi:hypothetical protein